jgi:hypothetical protein
MLKITIPTNGLLILGNPFSVNRSERFVKTVKINIYAPTSGFCKMITVTITPSAAPTTRYEEMVAVKLMASADAMARIKPIKVKGNAETRGD